MINFFNCDMIDKCVQYDSHYPFIFEGTESHGEDIYIFGRSLKTKGQPNYEAYHGLEPLNPRRTDKVYYLLENDAELFHIIETPIVSSYDTIFDTFGCNAPYVKKLVTKMFEDLGRSDILDKK